MHRLTSRVVSLLVVTGMLFAAPAAASADFLVEPFFAWSRSGPVAASASDTALWHPGGGVAATWLSRSIVASGEVGYASGFFDPKQPAGDLIQTSQLLTVSGMAGITRPMNADVAGRVLPYATAGAGLIRQQARDREGLIDLTRNDPAINVGGGARYFFTKYIGVGGDVRYFVDLKKPFAQTTDLTAGIGRLTFWRVAASAVVRFGD